MAGMGPSPKPGAVNRAKLAYDWVHLPAEGRGRPAPELPPLRAWSAYTERVWAELWATPMAARWREDDPALARYAWVTQELLETEKPPGPLLAVLTQLDDRLGLTPKSRMQLRWLLPDDAEAAPVRQLRPVAEAPARKRRELRKRLDASGS